MMKLGAAIALICGILVLVSVFLPWCSINADLSGLGSFTFSFSAWNIISGHGETGTLANHTAELLTMIGGILMMISALFVLLMLLFSGAKKTVATLGALAIISAVLAISGVMKYIFSDMGALDAGGHLFDYLGYGVYIALAFSILGLVFGVITVIKGRAPVAIIESTMGIAAPPAGTASSAREYYENKATANRTSSKPIETETTDDVVSKTTTSIPTLPPLPPTVDAEKAEECFGRACAFESAGKHEKAIEEYTKAISLDSKNTQAYFKRGLLLKEMGMKPAAISDFRRVIDASDSSELIDKAKSYIAEMT